MSADVIEHAAYYGLARDCDCIGGAVIDDPERLGGEVARFVNGFVRDGLRVVREEPGHLRRQSWRCPAHPEGTPDPWTLERRAKGLRERVLCPSCDKEVAVTKAGLVMTHNAVHGTYRTGVRCKSSGARAAVPA